MSVGPQAMFVVEYPCDRFCHIEVELIGERGTITLEQMWEKADAMHRREHEPDIAEADLPVAGQGAEHGDGQAGEQAAEHGAEQGAMRRPAATVFRAAPGRGVERRR